MLSSPKSPAIRWSLLILGGLFQYYAQGFCEYWQYLRHDGTDLDVSEGSTIAVTMVDREGRQVCRLQVALTSQYHHKLPSCQWNTPGFSEDSHSEIYVDVFSPILRGAPSRNKNKSFAYLLLIS